VLRIRDLSTRARFRLTGEDRTRFLHSMLTNDVESLAPGAGCRAVMLTVKGKTLCELALYCDADAFLAELDGERRKVILDVFARHIVMDDVEVEDVSESTREWGVYGDEAARALGVEGLAPYHHANVNGVRISNVPELAMPGFHVFGDAKLDAQPISDEEWEILRVEAGRPKWGAELDEDRLILEANMDDAVSLTKGCYLGQEVVARATARGHINRRLTGLRLDGDGPAARGSKLSAPAREDAGVITSSVVSPRFGAIALAYVHRSAWEPGTELGLDGGRKARVTALPFA
jgi:folate-binding protein YgfZ